MKRSLFSVSLIIVAANSFAQIKMPPPAPLQTIRQEFGPGTIELVYSRPTIKDRRVFGDLVPFDKLWRTGANAATTLSFSMPVEIGGKTVDSGSYALYTEPHEDFWEIMLNRSVKNWGTEGYKESADIVHLRVPVKFTKPKLETFTMQIVNISPEVCTLELAWENTMVSFPIRSKAREQLRHDIEAGLASDNKPYWEAAQFYFEYDRNDPKALENVKSAVAANPKAYHMWLYRAKIELEMGDKAAARASSEQSLKLAREAKDNEYVEMNEALQRKLK